MINALRLRVAGVRAWPRVLAALACLGLAALATAHAHARRPAATTQVLVTTRALAAGHVLAAGDLALARWPRGLAAADALTARAQAVNRRLANPLAAHEPITARRLLGASLGSGLPPGVLATPVDVSGARTGELVHPGDRIDILAAPGPDGALDASASGAGASSGRASIIATALRVLAVLPGTGTDSVVVVAADPDTARRLAQAAGANALTPLIDSP